MNRRLIYHLLFWLGYWLAFALINSRYDGDFRKYAIYEGVLMPARTAAVYLSVWWLRRFEKRANWLIFSGLASIVLLGGFVNRALKFFWVVPGYFPESSIVFWHWRAVYDVFDILLVVGVCLSGWLLLKNQANLRRAETLRAEKTAAELLALRNQVQPHFLFNTLNNIYALARQRSPKAAPVTQKLAQLLRFVLYESQKPEIALAEEVRILKDYIELEKLRFDEDRLRVSVVFDIENPQFPIAPLLLLPLVENAFKHGVGERRDDAFVEIELCQRGNRLDFKVKNALPENPVSPENFSGEQIGLKNVRRQMELVYPGNAGLEVFSGDGRFEARLYIFLISA